MILYLLLVGVLQAEVTVQVKPSGVKETQGLVLSGPEELLHSAINQLSKNPSYSFILNNKRGLVVRSRDSPGLRLNYIPRNYMELVGLVSSLLELPPSQFKIVYFVEEEFAIVSQETYDTAVELSGLQLLEVEAKIKSETKTENLDFISYYEKYKDSMHTEIQQVYQIVIEEGEFTFKELYLLLLYLDETQMLHLCKVLPQLTELEVMVLTGNLVTEKVAACLGQSFEHLPKLQNLVLSFTAVDWRGLKALEKEIKDPLELGFLSLDLNGFEAIEAKYLNLLLKKLEYLSYLDLSDNNLAESGVLELTNLPSTLTTLKLNNNLLGIWGTKALSKLLVKLPKLKTLSIKDNSLGLEGVERLVTTFEHFESLEVLELRGNKLGDKGVKALAEHFRELKALRKLDLSLNDLSQVSVSILSEHLKELTSLEELVMTENLLSPKDEHILHTTFKGLFSLTIKL